MATIGLSGGLSASIGTWIASVRRAIADDLARRRIYRRTLAELEELSERDLQDIGISRMQIGDVAREAAYRDR